MSHVWVKSISKNRMPTGFSSSLTFCLTVTNSRCERTNFGASDLSADHSKSQSNNVLGFSQTGVKRAAWLTQTNITSQQAWHAEHHLSLIRKSKLRLQQTVACPKMDEKNVILMEEIWWKQNNFEHGFILSGISCAVCCLRCDSLVMFSQHSRGRSLSKRTSFERRSLC